MLLAEDERLRLDGIVPIAPAGLDMARWMALVERDPVVRTVLATPLVPGFAVRRAVQEVYRRLAFRRPGQVDPRICATFAGHLGDRAACARVLATGQRLLPELRDPFALDRIACPVLLVWGTHDLMVFRTGAERVLEAVPDARLELIEDCGHCPQIEAPERMAEVLLEFAAPAARAA
jgi:pimeloyl-ACP methyl ester carboxylesterase